MRQRSFRNESFGRIGRIGVGRVRALAGVALIGMGAVMFCGHLDHALESVRPWFGTVSTRGLGLTTTLVLAASRISQACGVNYEWTLRALFPLMLASSWPLILVMAGTALSREAFAASPAAKKDCRDVDPEGGRPTLE